MHTAVFLLSTWLLGQTCWVDANFLECCWLGNSMDTLRQKCRYFCGITLAEHGETRGYCRVFCTHEHRKMALAELLSPTVPICLCDCGDTGSEQTHARSMPGHGI